MRVNKAIEDGSLLREPARCAARSSAGSNVHLLGLVSYGGVHSHIDHLRALLRFAPEKTWIHAFTDGRDVSPHAAVHDLAELPQERIASVSGRYYAMDRDSALGAHRARVRRDRPLPRPVTGTDPVAYVQQQYDAGVTDEFVEPVALRGPAGDRARRRGDLLQLPPRPRAAALPEAARGRLRPDDDDPLPRRPRLPGRVRGAGGRRTRSPRCSPRTASASSTAPRRRSTRTSPTSSTAAARRSGRGRRGSSSRRPRDVGTYDQKPEMSAPEVAARVRRRDRRAATASGSSTSPTRTWSGTRARSRPRSRRSRRPTAASARSSTAVEQAGGVDARHRRPRERRDDARGGRRQPAHGAHDEPRPARRHRSRALGCARAASCPIWPRPCLDLLGLPQPAEMTGNLADREPAVRPS